MKNDDRMQIGPEAAKQLEDHYSRATVGDSRQKIRESIRKWNAGEDAKTLTEAAMFDVFREIERKSFGI